MPQKNPTWLRMGKQLEILFFVCTITDGDGPTSCDIKPPLASWRCLQVLTPQKTCSGVLKNIYWCDLKPCWQPAHSPGNKEARDSWRVGILV